MDEARRLFAEQGNAAEEMLTNSIKKALAEGDDAEALRLDELLQQVERVVRFEANSRKKLASHKPLDA